MEFSGIIVGMGSANERRRYNVTSSLIGWAHTQNGPWVFMVFPFKFAWGTWHQYFGLLHWHLGSHTSMPVKQPWTEWDKSE